MLTSLLCMSALLCSITMKFGKCLRYTLDRFVFKFHKNWMDDDVIMTSFKFSPIDYSQNSFSSKSSTKLCRISYGKLTKMTYSPTIQHFECHFQHFLMETTPILGMRRSTTTLVYVIGNCQAWISAPEGLDISPCFSILAR